MPYEATVIGGALRGGGDRWGKADGPGDREGEVPDEADVIGGALRGRGERWPGLSVAGRVARKGHCVRCCRDHCSERGTVAREVLSGSQSRERI